MLREIAPTSENGLTVDGQVLEALGQAANLAAASNTFTDYRERKAAQTIRRQDAGLALFERYLKILLERAEVESEVRDLATSPEAWHGITWGLVAGFMRWQLGQGYAVSSANVRLSTVKTYAKLAFKAGILTPNEYALIKSVEGYSRKESKRIDEQREADNVKTRQGPKKAEAVSIAPDIAAQLKDQPDTPQGRRDAFLMALLLDHGLRVSEVAILTVENFDMAVNVFTFYRPKVDRTQTHKLTKDTRQAAIAYLESDGPESGPIWRKSTKSGKLSGIISQTSATRALTKRVNQLGRNIGIEGLSAHDCRHSWATRAAGKKTPMDRLQDAGGWNSPAMPARYIAPAKVANEGVIID